MKKWFSSIVLIALTQLLIVAPVFSAEPEATVIVTEAQICQDVANREPVAPGDIFPADTPQLYCFTRISSDVETAVSHVWYKGDTPVAEIPLKVGVSSGWRTFSSKNIMGADAGNWRVEILSEDRTVLKKIHFALN